MAGFTTHTGRIVLLPDNDVDTDRIIPARYLTRVSRSGYGELLFKDVRGVDFPLDRIEAWGTSILVVGNNFGCGSSREHAVWAIQQAGFKAVISRKETMKPGFADIFRQNSANCGLLLIELDPQPHDWLVSLGVGAEVTVDLPNQTVSGVGVSQSFDINPAVKDAVLQGLDLVGTTLAFEKQIAAFEQSHPSFVGTPTVSV